MPKIPIVDPDRIPETIVAGPFNCTITHSIATLTFTHLRPNVIDLMATVAEIKPEAVVRARLVMPLESLQELRNSLDHIIEGAKAERAARISLVGH